MLQIVEKFIEREKLLTSGTTVIVGFSGGMDSMVLLDLLSLLNYQCIAAHCNFHLRGDESDRDADFVKKWCKQIDIPFTSIDFDTTQYAAEKKISIEMAARELRYEWFETIRRQFQAEAVAVAHHKDDSVETVLLNLVRGTGIKGLTGIMPRNGCIVRPLLCVTRSEIEAYIVERGFPFMHDSTNDDDVFLRNSLRLNIIPRLKEINPSVKEAIWRTSRNLSEAEKVYVAYIQKAIADVWQGDRIDIQKLRETASPQSVLFEILYSLGFSSSVIDDAFMAMEGNSGKVFYSKSYRLIKDRAFFIIDPIGAIGDNKDCFFIEQTDKEISDPLRMVIMREKMPVDIRKSKHILYADASLLKFPLLLRKWKEGDWFIPFGMKGRKKLSDYFSDRKYSLRDKENAWVLLSGDDIVWIVGERSDERFKISGKTTDVFALELVEND